MVQKKLAKVWLSDKREENVVMRKGKTIVWAKQEGYNYSACSNFCYYVCSSAERMEYDGRLRPETPSPVGGRDTTQQNNSALQFPRRCRGPAPEPDRPLGMAASRKCRRRLRYCKSRKPKLEVRTRETT